MSTSAHAAASRLVTELSAPAGLVNAVVEHSGKNKRIRVLVDRGYRYRLSVPKRFMGFDVVVDEKKPFVAFSQRV